MHSLRGSDILYLLEAAAELKMRPGLQASVEQILGATFLDIGAGRGAATCDRDAVRELLAARRRHQLGFAEPRERPTAAPPTVSAGAQCVSNSFIAHALQNRLDTQTPG